MTDLPPDVTDALRRGEPIEAMKRLRAAAHLSLRDAKAAIDRATGQPPGQIPGKPSLQEFFRTQAVKASKSAPPDRPSARPSGATQPVPPRSDAHRAPREGDLSPGEMPRRGSAWVLVVVIAAAVYAWFRLRG
jgi:hypothetical protein